MSEPTRRTARPAAGPLHPGPMAALEEVPVRRHVCTVPAPPREDRGMESRQAAELLEKQNALLYELLCAVNGLAAILARRPG